MVNKKIIAAFVIVFTLSCLAYFSNRVSFGYDINSNGSKNAYTYPWLRLFAKSGAFGIRSTEAIGKAADAKLVVTVRGYIQPGSSDYELMVKNKMTYLDSTLWGLIRSSCNPFYSQGKDVLSQRMSLG